MLLTGTHLSAQVLYSCDFENATENGFWNLNKTSTSRPLSGYNNLWHIGPAGNCANGTAGLYIASKEDTTKNVAMAITGPVDYVVAYRDQINLGAAGTYTLAFDWRCAGKTSDMLSVFWFPSTYTSNTNSNYGAASLPTAWTPYKIADFRGSSIWQSYYNTTFTTPTPTGKLLFVWYQTSGNATNPPAAVDNIEISQINTSCAAPTNLQYNTSGTLTWNGNAAAYDVRYANTNTDTWDYVTGVTGNSCPVPNITEGYYLFQVRAVCDGGAHSVWTSLERFAYLKGVRCLDFMDLDSARCYRGPFDNVTGSTSTMIGKVDHGYASINSFHTVHYMPGETDPRAQGILKTIPDGEVASVRLGNWLDDPSIDGQGAGEAIEYKYKVRAGQSDIMLLKYAVVMEKPGHNNGTDPHFTLEILDSRGRQISPATCFKADFAAASNNPAALVGWHEWEPGSASGIPGAGSDPIIWKPWTTMSVSLRNYVGQTLTIRFTTMDCRQAAHWAYAYFTIGCTSGDLQGIACGDFETDHFTAPPGFNYEWYKASNPNTILGTDSVFSISKTDTALYVVDVISKTADACYYSLTANPNPRFPETKVTCVPEQRECENYVKFLNASSIVYINRLDSSKSVSKEAVEDISWDFGDGSPILHSVDPVLEHKFPQAGGTFNVKVKSMMSGGVCEDERIYTLNLPVLGDKRVETITPFCFDGKTPYVYNGQSHFDSFQDSAVYHLPTGCDSTDVLTVNFVTKVTTELYDTVCGEVNNYTYNGTVYSEAGDYPVPFKSALGCDSIVTLHLYKHPKPLIQVDSAFASCADEISGLTIPYLLTDQDKTVDNIRVIMNDEAVANGFAPAYPFLPGEPLLISWPADINPNVYQGKVVFSSDLCQSYSYDFKIELYYPSATLDQKNGIVAVMNPNYNGGYDFVSYQWYRNGERMEGETKSYIRVIDEKDLNAEYYAVVLRSTDNVVLRTCPITYTGGGWRDALETIQGESSAVKLIENGILYIIRDGVKYTVLGTTVRSNVH